MYWIVIIIFEEIYEKVVFFLYYYGLGSLGVDDDGR